MLFHANLTNHNKSSIISNDCHHMFTNFLILIHVCTDQPFTLSAPSGVTVVEGQSIPVSSLLLNDRDSDTSIFVVNISASCGYLSALNMGNIVNVTGSGSYGPNIQFEGLYGHVQIALLNISFTATGSCGMRRKPELIIIEVTNLDNLTQNISIPVHVDIL